MPVWSRAWLLLWMGNAGVPLSSGIVGELQLLVSVYGGQKGLGLLATVGMVISGAYSISIYGRMTSGKVKKVEGQRDVSRREGAVLLVLVSSVYLLGVWPWVLLAGRW